MPELTSVKLAKIVVTTPGAMSVKKGDCDEISGAVAVVDDQLLITGPAGLQMESRALVSIASVRTSFSGRSIIISCILMKYAIVDYRNIFAVR
jgi:hypothetical protein